MPQVSIVIPLYNKEEYILNTINSALSQTFSDFEVVVVDDGSTDCSVSLIESVGDERIRIISQHNAGPGAARNRAVEEASGDLIAFLDADDEWMPEHLDRSVQALNACKSCGYSFTKFYRGDSESNHVRDEAYENLHTEGESQVSADWDGRQLRRYIGAHHTSSIVVRRRIFLELGGFYSKDRCLFGEDHYFILKLVLYCSGFFIDEVLCRYRSDASDLNRMDLVDLPPEPAIYDRQELMDWCPPHYSSVLTKHLYFLAMIAARRQRNYGNTKESKTLLAMYPYNLSLGLSSLRKRFFVYVPNRARLRSFFHKN